MRFRLTRVLPALLLVLGVAAIVAGAACGDDDDKATPTPSATSASPSPSATASPTPTLSSRTPTPSPTPTPTLPPDTRQVVRLAIPRFGVDAPIENLGLDADGAMQTPARENTDVGFYPAWDKPGRVNQDNTGWLSFGKQTVMPAKGNAVFSAHVYYHNDPAPFKNLYYNPSIQKGDDIIVTMDDGSQYHYKVIEKDQYNRDTIPMGDIIWPSNKPADKEWITLISCGGALDSTGQEYVDRLVVVAELVDTTAGTPQT